VLQTDSDFKSAHTNTDIEGKHKMHVFIPKILCAACLISLGLTASIANLGHCWHDAHLGLLAEHKIHQIVKVAEVFQNKVDSLEAGIRVGC
jgi:hypothetical protein